MALTLLCVGPYARAESPVTVFNLPAQPLPQAVLEFYRQSGVRAIYAATPQVLTLRTHAVHGALTSSAALSRMLRGTGLTFTFDSAHAVIIRPAPPPIPSHPRGVRAAHTAPRRINPQPDQTDALLQPVDVTGSLIRGVRTATAPIINVGRTQLEQTDYPSVADALYALPLISLNGPREDLNVDNNVEDGAGINLRGLGVGATLVLVDGHRQPLGGLTGGFVDVSTIPWIAVKRIEVLPDGASALYGADAVAGVVNIMMRNGFQGAETLVRYGSAINGRSEWMFGQLFGTHWRGGHGMIAYEYTDATPLAASARAYAANADKTPFGGANYDSYYTDPGNILNPLTLQPAYGIPSGQNGTALTPAALATRINLQNPFADFQIFPERVANEVYGSASQRVGAGVGLFVQVRYAQRDVNQSTLPNDAVLQVPPSNPYFVNPYPSVPYTLVAYSFLHDLGPTRFAALSRVYDGTVGATAQLGRGWQLTASESFGKQYLRADEYGVTNPANLAAALADSNPATAFNAFGYGSDNNPATLAAIGQDYRRRSTSTLESSDLVANGPLLRVPAGEAKLAVGLEWRTETLALEVPQPSSPRGAIASERYGRRIFSAYSQLHVPLLGGGRDAQGPARLALDIAGRYDHYSDFGGTFNPMARLEWIASDWLKLRTSWGRSYRAPTLDDLYDTSQNVSGLTVVPDPRSSTGSSLVLAEQGSNPNLANETARTWTAGFDLTPWSGAQLSLTFYDIAYWNRIEQPAAHDPFAVLQDGNEWAAVINRAPTPAEIEAICESRQFIGPVATCLASHPAAIVDLRLANLSATRTRGLDIAARERLVTRWGHFHFGLRGTDVLRFDQALTPTSPSVSILNTVGNPLSLRLRGTAGWCAHGRTAPGPAINLALNYTGPYRNPASTLVPAVSAWTTVDVFASERLSPNRFGQTTVWLNAVNVFNRSPPFVDSEFGYDIGNVQALGRVLSLQISQRW
jgi:outer membrane receptor protein involved in Fe transport